MNSLKVLVIRRDNIGDLILTMPLIESLKSQSFSVDVLANAYNVDILQGNSDIDQILFYQKLKHVSFTKKFVSVFRTLGLIQQLRAKRYDAVILAGSYYSKHAAKYARWTGCSRVISYAPKAGEGFVSDVVMPLPQLAHHAEVTHHLISALVKEPSVPKARIYPDAALVKKLRQKLFQSSGEEDGVLTIGIHISARKPDQRWTVEQFSQLIRILHQQRQCRVVLFWAPGDEDDPHHPGDDKKAQKLMKLLAGLTVYPCHTTTLPELIAGVSLLDYMICSDGGAMHIAAALDKPIVCLFGSTDPTHWHPWRVPYQLLRPQSRKVEDIPVEEVVDAVALLIQQGTTTTD